MYVEGRILSTDGKPVPDAVIETWETDSHGMFEFSLSFTMTECSRVALHTLKLT